jgi:ABC-2 type transport system permease protein
MAQATIAKPQGWLSASARQTLDLILELATTQFKLRYTGSWLGYLWSLIKPLMIFGIMYAVFGLLFKVGANTPNFGFQLLLGIVIWTMFAETTGLAMNAIASRRGIVQKAYFPRWILVVSGSLTALLTFLINFTLVLAGAVILHAVDLQWASLAIIPLFIELYALALGIGLLLASLFVYYRDLGHIWEIIMQAGIFGSAVMYPLTIKPNYAYLLGLNPMAQIINDARHFLISQQVVTTSSVLGVWAFLPIAASFAVFVIGAWVFSKLSPNFAENL